MIPSTITFRPPNHTRRPIAIDEENSAIGKKIELYQTVFNQAFLCFSLIFSNFLNSSLSVSKS